MTDTPPPGAAPATGAPPLPDVSANIRAELARRRRTVRDAQGAMNISSSTWDARMSEPGFWRLKELEALADWLGVELTDLVRGTR